MNILINIYQPLKITAEMLKSWAFSEEESRYEMNNYTGSNE